MCSFWVNLCLIALLLGLVLSVASSQEPIDGEFLFDISHEKIIDMPPSCYGENFCFYKGDDYPQDQIDELLNQMPLPLPPGIETSFNMLDGDDGNDDCPVDNTFVNQPIYYIVDEDNFVRVVIQSPGKIQQLYSAKGCQYPGRITRDTPHFIKGSAVLQNYKVECVNVYMDCPFMVLADEFYGLRIEFVRPKGGIPVSCRCRYSEIETIYTD